MELTFDTKSFDDQMSKLLAAHPAILEKVSMQCAFDIKAAAETQPPKTPHREGNLRADVDITSINPGNVKIIYKQPYASLMHEGVDPRTGKPYVYHETDCGAKYLETQLLQGDRWGAHMANIHSDMINEVI